MKLTDMVTFVLEQFDLLYAAKINQDTYVSRTKKYADFFKQPNELGFFVPCDLDGNVLSKPKCFDSNLWSEPSHEGFEDCIAYQEALDKVLFEGFIIEDEYDLATNGIIGINIADFDGWLKYNGLKTISDVVKYDLTLTPTAIKKIFG